MAKKDYKRKTSNTSNDIRLENKGGYNRRASHFELQTTPKDIVFGRNHGARRPP